LISGLLATAAFATIGKAEAAYFDMINVKSPDHQEIKV